MKTGDAIHSIANPIARSIDAIWGSDLAGCSGCSKMRDNLNSGMSFWEAVKQRSASRKASQNEQQTEGETKMQFQIQTVVEADSVQDALTKLATGTVISVTPRPQPAPPRTMNPAINQGTHKVG